MITIFDNLPDAILLAKKSKLIPMTINDASSIKTGDVGAIHFDLMYCNQQTDNLFKTQLSKLKEKR